MIKKLFLLTLTIGLQFLLTSCAYRFSSLERGIPGGYNRVSVPVFKNLTFEPSIESFFTQAMIEELERDRFTKVTSKADAQVILEGTITQLHYVQGSSFQDDILERKNKSIPIEYSIRVFVNLQLKRVSDEKILWSGNFDGEKLYPAPQITNPVLDTANSTYNHSARMQNLRVLARDLMSEAHMNLTENF